MRRAFVIVAAPAIALGVVAACVGSDPAATTSSVDDASVGTSPSEAATETATPIYGIFLTSKLYRTDFLADAGPDGLRDRVNQECVAAATRAGLPAPDRYIAIIAAEPETSNGDERTAVIKAVTADSGMWCPVTSAEGDAQVDCVASPPIFASPSSFVLGPDRPLLSDENGQTGTSHPLGSFLSGLVIDAGATSAFDSRVRNCLAWSAPASLDSGVDASQAQAGFGNVALPGTPSAGAYLWLTSAVKPCDGTERPLLCMQRVTLDDGGH